MSYSCRAGKPDAGSGHLEVDADWGDRQGPRGQSRAAAPERLDVSHSPIAAPAIMPRGTSISGMTKARLPGRVRFKCSLVTFVQGCTAVIKLRIACVLRRSCGVQIDKIWLLQGTFGICCCLLSCLAVESTSAYVALSLLLPHLPMFSNWPECVSTGNKRMPV